MRVTQPTIKRLFGLAHNRCAFLGCDSQLIEESGTVTAQMCHIHAANKKGPRYDASQTEEERHGFSNLLLLCPRHHIMVDAEPRTYTAQKLREFKRLQGRGVVEISPEIAAAARVLFDRYSSIDISNNTGHVAFHSPGAIQATNVTLKTQKNKVTVGPTPGSVASDLAKRSYVDYLIRQYQECQKMDTSKEGEFKYIAIHTALRRKFGCKWEFVPVALFDELVEFLKDRITKTKLGRIQKAKGHLLYRDFAEHAL